MTEIRYTDKQMEIVRLVLEAADRGEDLTVPMLMDRLSWKTVWKQGVIQQLQIVEKAGLIHKEYRGKNGMLIRPTRLAYTALRTLPVILD